MDISKVSSKLWRFNLQIWKDNKMGKHTQKTEISLHFFIESYELLKLSNIFRTFS